MSTDWNVEYFKQGQEQLDQAPEPGVPKVPIIRVLGEFIVDEFRPSEIKHRIVKAYHNKGQTGGKSSRGGGNDDGGGLFSILFGGGDGDGE